jgi:hypothetical protein
VCHATAIDTRQRGAHVARLAARAVDDASAGVLPALALLGPQFPPSPPLVRILCRVAGDVVGEPVIPAAVDLAAVEPAGPADGAAEDDAAAVELAGPLLADDAASVEPAGPALADNSGRSVPVMPAAAVDVPRLRILCRFFGGLTRGGGCLRASAAAVSASAMPAGPVLVDNAAFEPAMSDARGSRSCLTLVAVSKPGGHGTITTGTSQPIAKLPQPET